jgi:hypothetical protein
VLLQQRDESAFDKQIYERYKLGAHGVSSPALLTEESVRSSSGPANAALQKMLTQFSHTRLAVNLVRDISPLDLLDSAHGKITLATLGAWPELWPALRSGQLVALVGPLDREVGRTLVQVAADTLMHGRPSGFERSVDPRLVTASNLDEFSRDYLPPEPPPKRGLNLPED